MGRREELTGQTQRMTAAVHPCCPHAAEHRAHFPGNIRESVATVPQKYVTA